MYLRYAILADTVTQDASGKLSAIGIFDAVAALNFPMRHRDLCLVANIEGSNSEKGPHKISIELRDEDDNRTLTVDQDIDLGNNNPSKGNLIARVILRMQDLPFQKAGQYQFVFFCDNRFLGRINFAVTKMEMPKQG